MAIISIPTSVSGIGVPGTVGKILKGPLAALYQGKGVDTVNYPHDLAKDPTQSHYVSFSVKQVVPSGYYSEKIDSNSQKRINLPTAGKLIAGGVEVFGNAASGAIKYLDPTNKSGESREAATGVIDTIGETVGVKNLSGIANAIGPAFAKGFAISPQTTTLQSIISLYMPDNLVANYDADYESLSLTANFPLLTTLRSIDQMAGKIDTSSLGAAFSSLKGLKNVVSNDPNTILLAKQANVIDEDLQSLLLGARGFAINPQTQMIYRGLALRNFQLDFTLSPRSKQEADDIDRIISTFKWHFAPSLEFGKGTATSGMFMIQPSIFNIEFKIGKKENRYLPKYGDCVLRNISVNYAPNGWAAYEEGFPVQTHLSLHFEEMVILDKDKLQKGFEGSKEGLR
jgi:hypothetical protein